MKYLIASIPVLFVVMIFAMVKNIVWLILSSFSLIILALIAILTLLVAKVVQKIESKFPKKIKTSGKTIEVKKQKTEEKSKVETEEPELEEDVDLEDLEAETIDEPSPSYYVLSDHEEELADKFHSRYFNEIRKIESVINEETDLTGLHISELDPEVLALALEKCNRRIEAFEKLKTFCQSKGKGGALYFKDMWESCHNSQNPCFSYIDSTLELKEEIESMLANPYKYLELNLNTMDYTKNLYDFFQNYDSALVKAKNLKEDELVAKLTENKLEYVLGCYRRHIDSFKTEKAKQNKHNKFIEKLPKYLSGAEIIEFGKMLQN